MTIATLAELTLRCSVLLAVVWLLLTVCRMRDARTEKLLWTMVATASIAMPLIEWGLTLLPVSLGVLPSQSTVLTGALIGAGLHDAGVSQVYFMVLAAYGLGATVFLIRWATGLWLGARLCRGARRTFGAWRQSLDVRVSSAIEMPTSFGATILMPADFASWDAGALAAVVAHEREHIRNHDGYRLWIAEIYRAMFWFNPLAHWLCRRLRELAELTSDEAALAVVGDRAAYRDLLLQFASRAQPVHATLAMASRSALVSRVERLCKGGGEPAPMRRSRKALVAGSVSLAVALICGCAAKPLVLRGAQASAVHWIGAQSTPLSRYYPEALRRRHVEGLVKVRLTIDAAGRVTRAVVLAEHPQNPGFAAAALKFVRSSRFHNTLSRSVIMNLNVRFKLRKPSGSGPPSGSGTPSAGP